MRVSSSLPAITLWPVNWFTPAHEKICLDCFALLHTLLGRIHEHIEILCPHHCIIVNGRDWDWDREWTWRREVVVSIYPNLQGIWVASIRPPWWSPATVRFLHPPSSRNILPLLLWFCGGSHGCKEVIWEEDVSRRELKTWGSGSIENFVNNWCFPNPLESWNIWRFWNLDMFPFSVFSRQVLFYLLSTRIVILDLHSILGCFIICIE